MKSLFRFLFLILCISNFASASFSQNLKNDSVKIDYEKIYSYCLDGNISPALSILKNYDKGKLSAKDLKFKTEFENRYGYAEDKSDFLENHKSSVDELLKIYRDYWRNSMLDNSKNYDTLLGIKLADFLSAKFHDHINQLNILNDDSLDVFLKKYITSSGLRTTGFGRTGKFLDLLIWKSEKDTVYQFSIYEEKIKTPVHFMDDFVTLGWEEYATLGRAYPGGWATSEALFCVRKAYDLKSEDFLISYLCHEGRHFSDYKLFPKLKSAELEYRAKLTELSLLKDKLYETINFFIVNANYKSDNGHSVANYCVIRDLSKAIFKVDFEKDINKWKEISVKKINKSAYEILKANTKELKTSGKMKL